MLVDTDVLIWNLRGNAKAADRLDALDRVMLSSVTYMELVQGMRNKEELRALRLALAYWEADIVHVDEEISSRATFLVEQHYLAGGLRLADALIAATALDLGETLLTANDKHYRSIKQLSLDVFRP
jgi:hypothetical protein